MKRKKKVNNKKKLRTDVSFSREKKTTKGEDENGHWHIKEERKNQGNHDNNDAKLRERCSMESLEISGEKKKKNCTRKDFFFFSGMREETSYALCQVFFSFLLFISISNQTRVRLCPHISLLLIYLLIYFYSYSLLFLKVVRWFPKSTLIYFFL